MSMHVDEDSDEVVVPAKRSNKGGSESGEGGEGRASAKGKGGQATGVRTPRRGIASNRLEAVRQAARQSRDVRFTALLHHITIDLLKQSYKALKRDAAPGIDGVTWWAYGENLEAKLRDLHERIHKGSYRARPAKRSYIPKADGSKRPLSICFLEHRIADKRILRLVAKWLKVGIVEDGCVTRGERGAPQGAVISPILANVYLHYVYDLWVHHWRRTRASGDMIVIRYADDTIVGFQHEHEATAFLDDLKERMRAFELALHPDKTRLIRFGRYAARQRTERGEGKPETFDFLGFTHFCTRSRNWGSFVIGRKTIKKRMVRQLQAIKMELRRRMHDPIAKTGAWMEQMLKGHLNYYAVSGNDPSLWSFVAEVRWRWLKTLKRRSQRAFLHWDESTSMTDRFFPPIKILHPQPLHRFDARTRGRSPVR